MGLTRAILALLVRRLRLAWPEVKIVFRGDSDFCRPLILNWCDHHGVYYIIGLAGNQRLAKLALDIDYESVIRFEMTWEEAADLRFHRICCGHLEEATAQGDRQLQDQPAWLQHALRGHQPSRLQSREAL